MLSCLKFSAFLINVKHYFDVHLYMEWVIVGWDEDPEFTQR